MRAVLQHPGLRRRPYAILGTAVACACWAVQACAADHALPPQVPKVVAVSRAGDQAPLTRMRLIVNKSETVRLETAVGDVLVGSTEIADVIPMSDRTLYLLGKKEGATNVSLFDTNKKLIGVIDILVGIDLSGAQEEGLRKAAYAAAEDRRKDAYSRQQDRERAAAIETDIRRATGVGGLQVRADGGKTVLLGLAPDAATVDRAMQVVPPGTVNLTRIASPQQVMLKVRFVEVNRNAGRELGIRFEYNGRNALAASGRFGAPSAISSSSSHVSETGVPLLSAANNVVSAATAGVPFANVIQRLAGATNNLDVIISALEEKGLVRRLAEPNLIALSGGRAEFLAGGEMPVPTATTTGGGFPTITVTFREFGVKLGFTPTVLADGAIHLELEPEVSDIDPSLSVPTGGGIAVPGLIKRRAKTSVQLRDGQSFAIAGLLQNISSRTIDQVPWLGSIPVIGALFSSKAFQERETELVVIVTPTLVKPAKPGQLLATPLETSMPPNDLDFFASGKLELRRNMREFVTKEGAAVGPHGHLVPAVVGDQMAPN